MTPEINRICAEWKCPKCFSGIYSEKKELQKCTVCGKYITPIREKDETETKHICTECESFRSVPFERVCAHPSNVKLNYTTGEKEPVHSLKELNGDGTCKKFGEKKKMTIIYPKVCEEGTRRKKPPNFLYKALQLFRRKV